MTKTTVTKKIRRGIGQTRTFTAEEIRQIQTRPPRVFDFTSPSEEHRVANAQVELKRLHRLARSVGSEHDDASTFDDLARLPEGELKKVFKKNAAKRLRRYKRRTSALLAIVLPITRAADLAAAARGEVQ